MGGWVVTVVDSGPKLQALGYDIKEEVCGGLCDREDGGGGGGGGGGIGG